MVRPVAHSANSAIVMRIGFERHLTGKHKPLTNWLHSIRARAFVDLRRASSSRRESVSIFGAVVGPSTNT